MSQVDTIVKTALGYVGKRPSRYYKGKMTYCQRFVTDCYAAAGLGGSAGSAMDAKKKWMISSDLKNVPAGAAVYLKSKSYPQYGHVGVSVGGGMMVDVNSGRITKRAIPSSAYGWGWNGGKKPSGAGSGSVSASGGSGDNETQTPDKPELKLYETKITGRQVFDAVEEDYHIYINGRAADYVADVELSESIDSLSAELSFKVPINPKDKYMTYAVKRPACGDKVIFRNGNTILFGGIIIEVGLDGTVKANDYGYYLNKQEIIFQCLGVSVTNAIKQMCNKIGLVSIGELCEIPTKITKNYINQTPAAILEDMLTIASVEQGKNYKFKVRNGKLNVVPYPTVVTIANYRQPGGRQFDCSWLLGGVSGSQTMSDMRNKVVVVSNSDSSTNILATAEDKASQEKYGVLQTVVQVDDGAAAATKAKAKLKELNVITESYSVDEMLGADIVSSGMILYFSSDGYGLKGLYLTKSVTHKYSPNHTMSLELIKVVQVS